MPPHDVYLELYGGGASVLLNKERSHIETINDIDGEIVNFFRILRDRENELIKLISLTPYSREEFIKAYEPAADEVEQARRYCVRCWMGFGCGNRYKAGFKSGQQAKSPNPAKGWRELPEIMHQAAERLRGVQIESLPALELLKRYDTADVFIYIDPPYMPGTRKGYLYVHEMTEEDHEELLKAVVNHPGKIMISGYDNKKYNDYLSRWNKAQIKTQAENGLPRIESLWMNYQTETQLNLFSLKGV